MGSLVLLPKTRLIKKRTGFTLKLRSQHTKLKEFINKTHTFYNSSNNNKIQNTHAHVYITYKFERLKVL